MDAPAADLSPIFCDTAAPPIVSRALADPQDPDGGEGGFLHFIHALDLRHFSLVGTIYRAFTGDVLPAPLRAIGSIAVGFLAGGPIGAIGGAVLSAAEGIYDLIDPPGAPAVPGDVQTAGAAAYARFALPSDWPAVEAPGPAHA